MAHLLVLDSKLRKVRRLLHTLWSAGGDRRVSWVTQLGENPLK